MLIDNKSVGKLQWYQKTRFTFSNISWALTSQLEKNKLAKGQDITSQFYKEESKAVNKYLKR